MHQTTLNFTRKSRDTADLSGNTRQPKSGSSLSFSQKDSYRAHLKALAEQTLAALDKGSYEITGIPGTHDLQIPIESMVEGTSFYCFDGLDDWDERPLKTRNDSPETSCRIRVLEQTTLEGTWLLDHENPIRRIGILNFASAHKPGGGMYIV